MSDQKKAVLITGAMGGLGQELVRSAHRLTDIDTIVAADIDERITAFYRNDPRVTGLIMNAGSQESIVETREKVRKSGISVKYIINNAGIMMFLPVSEATDELLDQILRVNTYGPVLTVSTFLDDLIRNKGRVIQISSDNVRLSGLFQPYPSSKIAMESLSIAMRQELSLFGIKLIIFRPGAIETHLLDRIKSGERSFKTSRFTAYYERFEAMALKEVGRTIRPDKVARLVIKSIQSRNPRNIYTINKNSMITLLSLFPDRFIDKIVTNRVTGRNI